MLGSAHQALLPHQAPRRDQPIDAPAKGAGWDLEGELGAQALHLETRDQRMGTVRRRDDAQDLRLEPLPFRGRGVGLGSLGIGHRKHARRGGDRRQLFVPQVERLGHGGSVAGELGDQLQKGTRRRRRRPGT